MPKSVNTLVGSRPSATGYHDVAFVSRAPSRHHDASTRLLSIWPVPEGVRSLDAEHPESVWYATQDARSPLPVKEAGHGSASPPTDWGLFSGPSSLTADESWVIGEGGRRSEAEGSLALSRKGVRGNPERRRSLSQLRAGATARSLLRRGVLPAWPHLSLGTEPRAGDPRV